MQHLLILGAGTAGTMMAHHLHKRLPRGDWQITVVDRSERHYYQPGFLFLPFGMIDEADVVKPTRDLLPSGVDFVCGDIGQIDPVGRKVTVNGHEPLDFDLLIVATGSRIAPEETEGMIGTGWRREVFDFYTFDGSRALRDRLATWGGGRLVVHVTEMPIKCPVAPLEFTFLADTFFRKRGLRDKVDITYVTPLSGAFTKPKASKALGHLLADKGIALEADFAIERVDQDRKTIVSYEGREVPYDLLVTTPLNMGSEVVAASGLGDDLGFIPTHKHTLQSRDFPHVFVIGDATNVPASKAGSVAHFEAETLTDNILLHIAGRPLKEEFDGHSNCFVESGNGKALLIDFSYEIEPHEGGFPFGWGPLRLLKESRLNHWGKLAFRWIYWHILLKARPLPGIGRQKRIPKSCANLPEPLSFFVFNHHRQINMQKNIAGSTLEVTEEGFLANPSQWNEAIAAALAAEEGVGPLTDAHWKVLQHLRAKHAASEEVTIRQLGKSGIVSTKDLYTLFPNGPLKKAAKIAGVPKPVGCI